MGVVIIIRHSLRGVNTTHYEVDGRKVKVNDQVSVKLPFNAVPMQLTELGIAHSKLIGAYIRQRYHPKRVVVRADNSHRTQMTGKYLLDGLQCEDQVMLTPTVPNDPIAYADEPAQAPMTVRHLHQHLFRIEAERAPVRAILRELYGFDWNGPSAISSRLKVIGPMAPAKSLATLAVFEYLRWQPKYLTITESQARRLAEFSRDCVALRLAPEVIEKRCRYLLAYVHQRLRTNDDQLTIIISHDTNIRGLIKLLDLEEDFQVDDWPHGFVPPTSGLVLEPTQGSTTVQVSSIGVRFAPVISERSGVGTSPGDQFTTTSLHPRLEFPPIDTSVLDRFEEDRDCIINYV